MDSVIVERGGFIDGAFQNGHSQLLPWPNVSRTGGKLALSSADYNSMVRNHKVVLDPLDKAAFFSSRSIHLSYYTSDLTVAWSIDVKEIWSLSNRDFDIFFVYVDPATGNRHVIGQIFSDNYGSRIFELNAETRESRVASAAGPDRIRNIGMLNDGTLFYTESVSGTAQYRSYTLNWGDLSAGQRLYNIGFHYPLNTGSFSSTNRSVEGVSLLNGSVTLLKPHHVQGTGGYSSDAVANVFAVNQNMDWTAPDNNKVMVQTLHPIAQNMWMSQIQQFSNDWFSSTESYVKDYRGIQSGNNHVLIHRTELERWASDCIYAQTGVRIPVPEGS